VKCDAMDGLLKEAEGILEKPNLVQFAMPQL
jgi:ferritin-like metal-binding protein YciE